MINPMRITNFERTDAELQTFWIFCILVAGKNADNAARVISRLLGRVDLTQTTPFQYFRDLGELGIRNSLVAARAGQYGRVTRAIMESLNLDLRTATVQDLEAVFGVGPKTARFFLLHSRPGVEVAVIDTHIRKWLNFHLQDVPEHLTRKQYAELEPIFISLAKSYFPGMAIADVDLLLWAQYSGRFDSRDAYPEPVTAFGEPIDLA